MRKTLIIILILESFLLVLAPTHAQLGDVFMEPSDVHLLFLPDDGSLLVRVSPDAEQTLWFSLHTTPDVDLQPELFDLRGDPISPEVTEPEENVMLISATALSDGDHFLQLAATRGGYVRLGYGLIEPAMTRPEGELTFLQDVIEATTLETFDDNSRVWWTGPTDNTLTEIVDGALAQTLIGPGRTLSGIRALAGTERRDYLLTATVNISGDSDDAVFGLVVRLLDAANFYVVQVAPELGAWRVVVLNESEWRTLLDWQVDSRLVDMEGDQILGVWVLGDTFVPLWDGQPLGHVRDETITAGGVGLYAEVAPNGAGTPVFTWDALRIAVQPVGFAWPQPTLPDAAQLTPDLATAYIPEGVSGLLEDVIVGEWFWNDEDDTQSMQFVFLADGGFEQSVTQLADDAEPNIQTGRWRVEEETTLVLEIEGLPEIRYHPTVAAQSMTIPELGNRLFVRLASE